MCQLLIGFAIGTIGKPESTGDVGAENSILGAQEFALEEQALLDQPLTNAGNRRSILDKCRTCRRRRYVPFG